MIKFFKSEKGGFTVEATIVFVISFMTLILMMYIGIVMYQHVHLQSVTDRIASRGSMMYATRTTNMKTGYKDPNSFWNSDPYRYILDGSYKGKAKSEIQAALNVEMGVGNVIKANPGDGAVVDIRLGLFSRCVEVIGKKSFNVPFMSIFGLDSSFFNLNVKSTAYIMDMPETIRNIDYASDLLHRIPAVDGAMEKVGELKGKLETFINKISIE